MTDRARIHAFVGTKAQFIKMAPVLREIQDRDLPYNLVLTGQHKETIDDLRTNFGIKKPDHVLYEGKDITGVFQMGMWLIRVIALCLKDRKKYFGKTDRSDLFLVHGDTISTLLGAIVGRLLGARVCHIESGLRSFNYFHPFPEELTRVLTFYLSNIYYCPGDWALKNVSSHKGLKVNTEANTLYDALQLAVRQTPKESSAEVPKEKFAVCTIHRFENIFKKKQLEFLVSQVEEIQRDIKVLFILHCPTRQQLLKFDLMQKLEDMPNVELRPRYDYFTFMGLIHQSSFLISDGGSNQEESFYLGKPCLLMRDKTERNEGIGENVVLSHYDPKIIQDFARNFSKYECEGLTSDIRPSATIVSSIMQELGYPLADPLAIAV